MGAPSFRRGGDVRIVIADDHRIVREGLRFLLSERPDIEIVGEAENGRELLELLTTTDVDVVVLDVRMPEMTGLDALARLKELEPEVRVIVLSMHDEPAYVRRAIELGAAGYLLKNTGREEFIKALELVAGGKAYVQGDVSGTLIEQVTDPEAAQPRLSGREREILQLISEGLENKQIARRLDVSEATVKSHVKGIFSRLDVRSRAEAVAVGLRLGIIH